MDKKSKEREASARFRVKQRAKGLCLDCANPVSGSHTRCDTCLERKREKKRKDKVYAMKHGLCIRCFKEVVLPPSKVCEMCYLKDISIKHFGTSTLWTTLRDKFIEQNRKCALSGIDIALGVNADLDHVIPVSLDGRKDMSNVRWVLNAVNRLKYNLLDDELFTVIAAVYHTMKSIRKEGSRSIH